MKRFVKVMALFAVFVLTLYVFDKLQPTITTVTKAAQPTPPTTYAVYEVRQLQWALDDQADYDYNSSLINLSSGEAKLKLQKVLKELKNQTTLTIQQKSSGKYNKKLEFESEPYSYKGTLKTLYFDAETPAQTSVKLKIRTASSQQALEEAEWQPKGKDYYTTTGQAITAEPNGYVQYKAVLETDDDTKTPMLNSVTITYETEEYPAEAAITTKEYSFARSVEIQKLKTEEQLNGQTVKYEYSTDSGQAWKTPVSGQVLAAAADKMLIKATLFSNKTETPAVNDIRLSYKISICDEKWQPNYTGCGKSNSRVKYYTDANSCGSTEDLPADNGTAESCDYCTPQWINVSSSCRSDDTITVSYLYTNTCCQETGLPSDCTIPQNTTTACDYCTPNWLETKGSCGANDRVTATFTDLNTCYAITGLQSDNNRPANKTYDCDYCAPSFVCGSYGDCGEDNKKACIQVNDSSSCYGKTGLASDNYTGNYSEFTASCAYDNERPNINSAIAAAIGDTLTVLANITDKSAITAIAHIIKDNDAVMNLTFTKTANNVYTASANAAELRGAYIVSIIAKDTYNNTATARGIAGVTLDSEKSEIKEIVLNSTGKALIVLANTATIEVRGKAEPTAPSVTGRIVVAEQATGKMNATRPQEKKELGMYIEIEADEALKSNVSSATLKISYTDQEVLAANLSETSLAIYYYDEPSLLWQQLNSTANAALNYVEGNTTHLSLFGVFGEQNQTINATFNATANATINATINSTSNTTSNTTENAQQSQAQPSDTTAAANAAGEEGASAGKEDSLQQTKPDEAAGETTKAQENCSYNVAVEVEDKPSFVNKTSITAALKNTGTCAIENLEVKVAQPLDDYVAIENGKAAKLEPEQSLTFTIKSKTAENREQAEQTAQGQPPQGFAVKEQRKTSTRKGKIIITGNAIKETALEGKLPLRQEVPLNIEVYELEQKSGKSGLAAMITGLVILAMLLTITYNRIIKFRRGGISKGGEAMKKEAAAEKEETKSEEELPTPKVIKATDHETIKFHESLKKFEEKENLRQQNLFSEGSSKNESKNESEYEHETGEDRRNDKLE
ncbi:hypothetical protein HYY73_04245 [Candidatus Woesearchaeota archaeon]|nr:hypothetical protein [Candidatus Woesearchaeota archaeon]